jgi:hypothetical protein
MTSDRVKAKLTSVSVNRLDLPVGKKDFQIGL